MDPLDRLTGTEILCITNTKKSLPSSVTMARGKRGFKFTADELESLAESVEEIVPISSTEWERVWNQHISFFPDRNRTAESLKRKFQEMARVKIPTGDPECPRHIRIAKRAYYAIVKATNGSTGGGSDDWEGGGLGEEEEEEGEDNGEESEGEEGGNVGDDDNEGGTSLGVDPTNLFGEAVRIDFEQGGQDGVANVDGNAGVEILVVEEGAAVRAVEGAAATASVSAASSHSVSTTGRGKRA